MRRIINGMVQGLLYLVYYITYVVEWALYLMVLVVGMTAVAIMILPNIHNEFIKQMIAQIPGADITGYFGFVFIPTLFCAIILAFACKYVYKKLFDATKNKFKGMRESLNKTIAKRAKKNKIDKIK